MVKNAGGNKTKGQARKFASGGAKNDKLRISEDECEVYAMVEKMLGNGMCHVLCHDSVTRLCHIRGKFRGRGKRDNLVVTGSWLLVGLREWATESKTKMQDCDLLEVYGESDKENLRDIKTVNWSIFVSNDRATAGAHDGLEFSNEQSDEHQAIMDEEFAKSKDTGKKTVIALGEDNGEEIDVEDI
jgi:translation initiation factor 1A